MIHLDFETRSKCNIWDTGAWVYAAHPSTEILCLAYAIDEGPVKIWTREDFLMQKHLGWPDDDLMQAISGGMLLCAHNALFEQCIWQHIMVKIFGAPRVPIKQWRCTAAKAAARSLPRSLKDVGAALNAPIQKSDEGYRIMMKLCKPKPDGTWHESPEDMQKLYAYCGTDVEAERAVDKLLPDLIPSEQTIWFLDQLINQRGIYVDTVAIDRSLEYIKEYTEDCQAVVHSVSGGQLDGVSRRMAVLNWCQSQGVDINGYTKADVQTALAQNLPANVREVLDTRVQLGKTSVAKYQAMKDSTCADNRIRDLLIYHGASTGRWAGKLIQLQNLPRGGNQDTDTAIDIMKNAPLEDFSIFYPDVMGTLSSCIRGMITAAPGNKLMVADYSAIEARVVFWQAGEEYGLRQFKEGIDLYVNMAKLIYNRQTVSKSDRQLGKKVILGCGYGMGPDKFLSTCLNDGLTVDEDLAQKAVSTYRTAYRRVQNSWFAQEAAAIRTVDTTEATDCGVVTWGMEGSVLYCQLPSKRRLIYNSPTLELIKTPWGEMKRALHFMGVDGKTKQWRKEYTYGGKIVENITQAIARDILAHAMFACEKAGYHIAFSVHDEIVSEVREDFGSTKEFEKILCDLPAWAGGCPITAEGWSGTRYKK